MNRQLSPSWTLAVLTGLNLFNYMDRAVLNAVRTPLADELHLNYNQSGLIATAFMLGYFITSPIFGYLGDRFSRKWLIAAGIFIWSLGTLLTGMASTFMILLAFRVMVGVGEASYATISPGLISDTFDTKKRNNALTIFFLAIPVGYALGYIFGGRMAGAHGWRSAFIWAGAPGLGLALILLPFKEAVRGSKDPDGADNPHSIPKLADVIKLFSNPAYQLVVWGYVAYTFALGAFSFWGPNFLEKIHGMSNESATDYFGKMIVFTGLAGTVAGGFSATAWKKRNRAAYEWVLTLSILGAAPAAAYALWTPSRVQAMWFLGLAVFLLFLSNGPVNTLILETVSVNLRSSAMALSIFMIHMFGDLWSQQIVGMVADRWNDLRMAVMILPVALVVGGLFWLALTIRTLRKPEPAV